MFLLLEIKRTWFFMQSNSRDSDSTLTPVSPASRRARKAATTDGADRSDSKVDNLFLENAGSDRDQEAEGSIHPMAAGACIYNACITCNITGVTPDTD